MKYAFKYYLHDDEMWESNEWIAKDSGIPLEIAKKITEKNPFYEVTLHCEYDDETGEVTLKAVDL